MAQAENSHGWAETNSESVPRREGRAFIDQTFRGQKRKGKIVADPDQKGGREHYHW